MFFAAATTPAGDATSLGSVDLIVAAVVLVLVIVGLKLLVQAVWHGGKDRQRQPDRLL